MHEDLVSLDSWNETSSLVYFFAFIASGHNTPFAFMALQNTTQFKTSVRPRYTIIPKWPPHRHQRFGVWRTKDEGYGNSTV